MSDPRMSGGAGPKLLAEAIAHHQGGRASDARRLYEQVLALDPNQPQALHLLGALTAQEQDYEQALQLMTRAAMLAPGIPGFHYNIGLVLARIGRWPQAADAFQRAIDLHPANADALLALGDALFRSGEPERAIVAYEKSIAIAPDRARVHQNLAAALRDAGRLEDALASCQRARAIEPRSAEILSDLGVLLNHSGRLDESIATARAALQVNPNFWPAMNNLVAAYLTAGRVDEALATARHATTIEKDSPSLRWNLACALLRSGELIEGFAEHEHRLAASDVSPRQLSQPHWDGRELGGARILIYADQGIGDTIFFARYVPFVAQRGGRIILECQKPLERLLRQMPGVEKVVASDADLPEFDYHCAVGTLPMVFKTTMQTIPADMPYIRADADLSGQWKKRLGGMGARLKVGVCWAGNPRNTNDRFRSMSVENLAPIAAAQHGTGILFFSLQKGIGVKIGPTTTAEGSSGKLGLTDFTAELRDFADTSALIDNLDLVISVDTAVAHLAGAMGKRTWVPLSTAADWRYFKDRDDSPWYPTMRLFRQTSPGDWTGPVNAIATELAELAKHPAQ